MTTTRPAPDGREDVPFKADKDTLAYDMAVIVCPPSNDRVERRYQFARRYVCLCLDGAPYLFQESLHALFAWSDDELGMEFTDRLSEEIEAVLHMGDMGFAG